MEGVMTLWSESALPAFHIFLVNLALSGDNVLVIAMTASRLPVSQRRRAITWGITAAVVLRVLLTAAATLLTRIPGLMIVGGVILYMVACRLLIPEKESTMNPGNTTDRDEVETTDETSFPRAIRMICVADMVMSLDNVLAVAGASAGNLAMMMIGMIISILFVLFFSRWIASLMERFQVMIYLGAGILAYTAAGMIVSSHELELLWNNGIAAMRSILTSDTVASLMTNGYTVFTRIFSISAVIGCLAWGLRRNRQIATTRELSIPEPEPDV
ncbi:MAG: YjbE family putative metal transport protein [Planctomycetia bacterium]|nr:YjbE family putative metal transport protein [Planctomycetia bacterium]